MEHPLRVRCVRREQTCGRSFWGSLTNETQSYIPSLDVFNNPVLHCMAFGNAWLVWRSWTLFCTYLSGIIIVLILLYLFLILSLISEFGGGTGWTLHPPLSISFMTLSPSSTGTIVFG